MYWTGQGVSRQWMNRRRVSISASNHTNGLAEMASRQGGRQCLMLVDGQGKGRERGRGGSSSRSSAGRCQSRTRCGPVNQILFVERKGHPAIRADMVCLALRRVLFSQDLRARGSNQVLGADPGSTHPWLTRSMYSCSKQIGQEIRISQLRISLPNLVWEGRNQDALSPRGYAVLDSDAVADRPLTMDRPGSISSRLSVLGG